MQVSGFGEVVDAFESVLCASDYRNGARFRVGRRIFVFLEWREGHEKKLQRLIFNVIENARSGYLYSGFITEGFGGFKETGPLRFDMSLLARNFTGSFFNCDVEKWTEFIVFF